MPDTRSRVLLTRVIHFVIECEFGESFSGPVAKGCCFDVEFGRIARMTKMSAERFGIEGNVPALVPEIQVALNDCGQRKLGPNWARAMSVDHACWAGRNAVGHQNSPNASPCVLPLRIRMVLERNKQGGRPPGQELAKHLQSTCKALAKNPQRTRKAPAKDPQSTGKGPAKHRQRTRAQPGTASASTRAPRRLLLILIQRQRWRPTAVFVSMARAIT